MESPVERGTGRLPSASPQLREEAEVGALALKETEALTEGSDGTETSPSRSRAGQEVVPNWRASPVPVVMRAPSRARDEGAAG